MWGGGGGGGKVIKRRQRNVGVEEEVCENEMMCPRVGYWRWCGIYPDNTNKEWVDILTYCALLNRL